MEILVEMWRYITRYLIPPAVLVTALGWALQTWLTRRMSHELDCELETHKADLSKATMLEIEKYKAAVGTENDIFKAITLRYSDKQFQMYNELWASLCDFESAMNAAWDEATQNTVDALKEQIRKTKQTIRKSAILIEENTYKQLNSMFDKMNEFLSGKELLEKLKNNQPNTVTIHKLAVAHENQKIKDHLTVLIDELRISIRDQVKINLQIAPVKVTAHQEREDTELGVISGR